MRIKDFQHNIQDVNKDFLEKERDIAFGGEYNPDVMFQLFQTHESFPVPRFQEAIVEMRRGHNRRHPKINKECFMAEVLSSRDTLVLENKWITQDPKSFAFASFISKESTLLDNLDKTGHKINETKKKKNFKKKTDKLRNGKWKFEVPRKVNQGRKNLIEKNHYYNKPHSQEGKTMWAMHKPSEHNKFTK